MPHVGARSLAGSGRAHRWSRLAQADNALSAVGGSDLCEAAMPTHPHVRTGLHACALPHLPRGPFRDAERLGAVQHAGAAEGISRDGRAPTGGVARPRAPLGQAVRALHVRRYHTLSTHSGHTAHHSARPWGPSHSQQCAAVATAVAACCTETRPSSAASWVSTMGNSECPSGVL